MAVKFVSSKAGGSVQHTGKSTYDQHLSTPVKASTNVTLKHGKHEEVLLKAEEETLNKGVIIPASQMLRVTVEGGATINLGNYESARIGVIVEIPTTKDDLDSAYQWATDWISEKIDKAVKEAKGLG